MVGRHYGHRDEEERRFVRGLLWIKMGGPDRQRLRPADRGRSASSISNAMKVTSRRGLRPWPLPPEPGNYAADRVGELRTDIKPLEITQPEGPSFEVDGHQVHWQKWRFVIGFNAREGLTLHTVRYEDHGSERSILYRASLTEMVVPYGDPGRLRSTRKNAFDVGEYGMGRSPTRWSSAATASARSTTSTPSWPRAGGAAHHQERDLHARGGLRHPLEAHRPPHRRRGAAVAAARDLVHLDGRELRVRLLLVPLPGRQHPVRGQAHRDPVPRARSSPARSRVRPAQCPGLYAPNHQHFFNVRLDFDLDGMANSVYEVSRARVGAQDNPLGNAFFAEPRRSHGGRGPAHIDPLKPRYWKVVNPSVKNAVGEPVGYKLMPHQNVFPFAAPSQRDEARRVRDQHLWATPYERRRDVRGGRLPEPAPGRRGAVPSGPTRPPHREHRRRVVVHVRLAHPARLEDWPVMPVRTRGSR